MILFQDEHTIETQISEEVQKQELSEHTKKEMLPEPKNLNFHKYYLL